MSDRSYGMRARARARAAVAAYLAAAGGDQADDCRAVARQIHEAPDGANQVLALLEIIRAAMGVEAQRRYGVITDAGRESIFHLTGLSAARDELRRAGVDPDAQ